MQRRREPEWMDEDNVDPEALRQSLVFIERVNRYLGYTRTLIRHLERLSAAWRPGDVISILDIATGSADVPREILAWGKKRGFDLRITAVDRQAATLQLALETNVGQQICFVRADALALPLTPRSFDYVICSMFLHHLSDEEAVSVIAAADRLSSRGFLIADLERARRAYAWISLFTLLSNPMVKHDARVSVKQAFTRDEILELCRQAKVADVRCHRHFGHRFVLVKEKNVDELAGRA